MITSEKKWYEGWEKDFSKDYLETLYKPSVLEIMDFLGDFLRKQASGTCYEVLAAQPGHGKTSALKVFIKKMIQHKHSVCGGLIVLREKEQMRELEEFASGFKYGVLYVDSDNFQEVKVHIPKYQFVIISHERLRSIALDRERINLDLFTKWRGYKRVIIIDEAPSFVDSAIIELDKGLEWLDDCFQAAKNMFSSEQRIMIRSIIQILIAKELIENKGPLTGALKKHIDDSPKFAKILNDFFKEVDNYIDNMGIDSRSMYKWFKKLYNEENIGYIDPGFYLDNYSDHKKIICSQRIDYRQLKCSILILDGTAMHTKKIYNNEYVITSLPNHTKYERLLIYQRRINTSARRRKNKIRLPIQKLIAKDIQNIKHKGINPFPLMNKYEINDYLKLKVINKQDYERYFLPSPEENMLPINLLNTIGKNHLANQNSLYLTSLPTRTASYYKAIAISLYKDSDIPLNMSMNAKEKKQKEMWFADQRIEELYQECLLSELYQIIHRSNIRNLSAPSYEKVHIFIATNFDHIINKLLDMFGTPVKFERNDVEDLLKFQHRVEQKITSFANKIKKEQIKLPNRIGKIEDGSSLKNLINKNWNNEERKREIIAAFHKNGLDIIERKNKSGETWKYIDYLKNTINMEQDQKKR